jgi:hypothetical protein
MLEMRFDVQDLDEARQAAFVRGLIGAAPRGVEIQFHTKTVGRAPAMRCVAVFNIVGADDETAMAIAAAGMEASNGQAKLLVGANLCKLEQRFA